MASSTSSSSRRPSTEPPFSPNMGSLSLSSSNLYPDKTTGVWLKMPSFRLCDGKRGNGLGINTMGAEPDFSAVASIQQNYLPWATTTADRQYDMPPGNAHFGERMASSTGETTTSVGKPFIDFLGVGAT